MAALLALAAALASCAGLVIGTTCTPVPPLVAPCAAVRACDRGAVCVVTVSGPVDRVAFSEGEAWGDWQARLDDAPAGTVAAAVPRLAGRAVAATPYTIFLTRGRPPLIADGLYLDDFDWLAGYRASGSHPDGLRPAPADTASRICARGSRTAAKAR